MSCDDDAVYNKMVEAIGTFHTPARQRQVKEAVVALAMRLATRRPVFSASLGLLLKCASSSGPDFVQSAFEEPVSALSQERLATEATSPCIAPLTPERKTHVDMIPRAVGSSRQPLTDPLFELSQKGGSAIAACSILRI